MTTVIGEAEEYELFGYPHTTQQDCDFLEAIFVAAGEPVRMLLDIACGTGRHALEMAKRGYSVTGVDISPDMLAAAKREAGERGLPLTFVCRDMKALDLEQEFDAAYILFNTISLLVSNDDLLQFLRSVRAALRPDGRFVLEVGNLWPAISAGKLANTRFGGDEEHGGVRRRRQTDIVIGPYNNVMGHIDHRRYWRGVEELEPRQQVFLTRIFSLNELDLACRLTGFRILDLFGATDNHARLEAPDEPRPEQNAYGSYVLVLGKTWA